CPGGGGQQPAQPLRANAADDEEDGEIPKNDGAHGGDAANAAALTCGHEQPGASVVTIAHQLVEAARELAVRADALRFDRPVAFVYNPLVYAWSAHEMYLRRFGGSRKE